MLIGSHVDLALGGDTPPREFERLQGLGVRFVQEPVAMGPVTTAVFDDTCGNLLQIAAKK